MWKPTSSISPTWSSISKWKGRSMKVNNDITCLTIHKQKFYAGTWADYQFSLSQRSKRRVRDVMASVLVYLHNDIAAILAEKNPSGIELNFPASISFNLLQSIRTLHTWVKTIYALTAIGGPKDSIRCLTFRKDERKSKKESKIRCFLNSALSNTDWCQNLVNLTWTVSFPRPQSSGRGNWAINLTLCATKPTDTEGYGCRFPPRILCVGYNKISVVKIDFRTDPRKFKLIVKGKRNASTFRGKRPLTCANTKIALVNIPCFLFRLSPGSWRSSSSGMISFPSAEISKSFVTLRLAAFLGSEASWKKFQHKSSEWLNIESIVVWKIL